PLGGPEPGHGPDLMLAGGDLALPLFYRPGGGGGGGGGFGGGTNRKSGSKDPCEVPDHPWYASVTANILAIKAAGAGGAGLLLANVLPHMPWDYKRYPPAGKYDDFGNFNFGATGAAAGFSEEVLLRGAGALKTILLKMAGKSNANGSPLGPPPY